MMIENDLQMFVTDFDGTLFCSDRTLSPKHMDTLQKIGEVGVIRVIATGRSLFSFQRTVKEELPVDYVIFSSGGCIARYPNPFENMLQTYNLNSEETEIIISAFLKSGFDFMIQNRFPENHFFQYHRMSDNTFDFQTRINFYKGYAKPLDLAESFRFESSQALAIVPFKQVDQVDLVQYLLPDFHVVRTTSPFDHKSIWIEVFPKSVSKSRGTLWLSEKLGVKRQNITAIGNDYNDLDLLEWAGTSFVVANAPHDLKEKFHVVGSNDNGGVSDAAFQIYKDILCLKN